jgi:hypothetical protein
MVSKSLSERCTQLTPAAVSSPERFPPVAITGSLADRLLSSKEGEQRFPPAYQDIESFKPNHRIFHQIFRTAPTVFRNRPS